MDAILICGSNVLFENFAAFAVFGVVGFMRMWPEDGVRLGAFVVGFLTLPEVCLLFTISDFESNMYRPCFKCPEHSFGRSFSSSR